VTLNNGTLTLTGNATINGTLTLAGGTLAIGANTLTINGAIDFSGGGTLTGGSSSNIIFGGSGASTTLPAITLNDLTINRTNGVSLGGNVNVGGTLTLTSGTLAVGTNTLTLSGAVSQTSGSLSSSATGTVNYNQSFHGQNVASGNYGNLTFSNFNKTLASSGTIGIAGTF